MVGKQCVCQFFNFADAQVSLCDLGGIICSRSGLIVLSCRVLLSRQSKV